VLPKKKNKKKVCDPQKNFSRWCYLQEVLPKKKIKKKYVIHKKTLVGGALEVLLVYFWLMASKEVLPKKKIKKKYVIHKTTLLGGALEVIHTGGAPQKKKKKVCDPQKNFSRWCYLPEVFPEKK